MDQPLGPGHREREDHAVCPADPVQRVGQGQVFRGRDHTAAQGVSMDAVAVLRQQAGQTGLAQVPAQHPEIQFTFHGVSLHSLLVQSMTGEKRGFRGRRVAVRAHWLGK